LRRDDREADGGALVKQGVRSYSFAVAEHGVGMVRAGVILRAAPWVVGGLLAAYFFLIFQDVRRMEAVRLANKTLVELDSQLARVQAIDARETVRQARRAISEDHNPFASLRLSIDAWRRQPARGGRTVAEARAFRREVWSALSQAWPRNTQIGAACLQAGCPEGSGESAYIHWFTDKDSAAVFASGRLYRLARQAEDGADADPDHVHLASTPVPLAINPEGVQYFALPNGALLLLSQGEEGNVAHRLDLNRLDEPDSLLTKLSWLPSPEMEVVGFNDRFLVTIEGEQERRVVVRKMDDLAKDDFTIQIPDGAEFGFAAVTGADRLLVAVYRSAEDAFEYELSAYDFDAAAGAWRAAAQPPLQLRSDSTLTPSQQLGDRTNASFNSRHSLPWGVIDPAAGVLAIPDLDPNSASRSSPVIIDVKTMARSVACGRAAPSDTASAFAFGGGGRLLKNGAQLATVDYQRRSLAVFDIGPLGGCRHLAKIEVEGERIAQLVEGGEAQSGSDGFLVSVQSGALYSVPPIASFSVSASPASPALITLLRAESKFSGHSSRIVSLRRPDSTAAASDLDSAFRSISEDGLFAIWGTAKGTLMPIREVATPPAIGAPLYARMASKTHAAVVGEKGAALIAIADARVKSEISFGDGAAGYLDPQTTNFSPESGFFYAPGAQLNELRVWDLEAAAAPAIYRLPESENDRILSASISDRDRFLVVRMESGKVAYADLTSRPSGADEAARAFPLNQLYSIPETAEYVQLRIIDQRGFAQIFDRQGSSSIGFLVPTGEDGLLIVIVDGRAHIFNLMRDGQPLRADAALTSLFTRQGYEAGDAGVQLLDLAYSPQFGMVALAHVGDQVQAAQLRKPVMTGSFSELLAELAGSESRTAPDDADDTFEARPRRSDLAPNIMEIGPVYGPLRWARPSIRFVSDAVLVSDSRTTAVLTAECAPLECRGVFSTIALTLSEDERDMMRLTDQALLTDEGNLSVELVSTLIGVRTLDWSGAVVVADVAPTDQQNAVDFAGAFGDADHVAFAAETASARKFGERSERPRRLGAPGKLYVGSLKRLQTPAFVTFVESSLGGAGALSEAERLRYGAGVAVDRTLIEKSLQGRSKLAAPGFLTSTFVSACEGLSGLARAYWGEEECLTPFRWLAKWRGVERDLEALMREDDAAEEAPDA
jgi:hypothetical protein